MGSDSCAALKRRDFLATVFAGAGYAAAAGKTLKPEGTVGSVRPDGTDAPLEGARWYVAEKEGDGFSYSFLPGTLAKARYLTADLLLDGNHMIGFTITLQEGENGRTFRFRFFGLNQCSFRMRLPLSLVDQNRWGVDREGAFVKPRCSGDRVDLAKVDRMKFLVSRKSPKPARWSMTDIVASETEVQLLTKPLLPKGPLIDEIGQSTIHAWPARSRGVEEVTGRIREQLKKAPSRKWPGQFTRWGGWKAKRLTKGAGFFRTHHDGKRWWLVDPDGYAFWSAGLDCVRVDTTAAYAGLETALKWLPPGQGEFAEAFDRRSGGGLRTISYLAANLIRAFGAGAWREKWAEIALAEMRRLRFNTVGNWSEWEFAKKAQIPYVRPLSFSPRRVKLIYRDLPDVYDPGFEKDAAEYAATLRETADDPAFVGYFLMNEPQWGFSSELPAAGMLYITESCESRKELGRFLRQKYGDDGALSRAWGMTVGFNKIETGKWSAMLSKAALADLEAFSVGMIEKYFRTLSAACKAADPNHLNLGMRWAGPPPVWTVEGMKTFDVYSFNCYRQQVPADVTAKIQELLNVPSLIGEWHFGALDAGLPSSGIGHLKNQAERAKAYSR